MVSTCPYWFKLVKISLDLTVTLHAFEVKKMEKSLVHFPSWVDLKVTINKHV